MIITQPHVRFPAPITLCLRIGAGPRPRVVGGPSGTDPDPDNFEFSELPLYLQIDALARSITALLPPIPGGLPLYGPDDFPAACADSMDDHAARVLQLLGSDPATALQALIDGEEMPTPPVRVPREIANWRAKAILSGMGQLDAVDAFIAALPGDQSTILALAWHGNAALARTSATVSTIAASLGLSSAQVDDFFIASEALNL